MNRSNYSDDLDHWAMIRWRGAVTKSIEGKRGQAFLRELRDALDAMPDKRLIAGELVREGSACAIGSVMVRRGIETDSIDVEDYETIASKLGIAQALVREIEFHNDESGGYLGDKESCERKRWIAVRRWVDNHIYESEDSNA